MRERGAEIEPDDIAVTMSDLKKLKINTIKRKLLHIEHRLGIPNYVVYHMWNLLFIIDSFAKYLIFNTNLFGHYTLSKGLFSIYSQVITGFVIAVLYFWCLISGTD